MFREVRVELMASASAKLPAPSPPTLFVPRSRVARVASLRESLRIASSSLGIVAAIVGRESDEGGRKLQLIRKRRKRIQQMRRGGSGWPDPNLNPETRKREFLDCRF